MPNSTATESDSQPSRGVAARIQASEVLRMWADVDAQGLLQRLSATTAMAGVRLVAVLPSQDISPEVYAGLERSNLLVVEVPESLAGGSVAEIADFLNTKLNEGEIATTARMLKIGVEENSPEIDSDKSLALSNQEEAELVECFNNPLNQLGINS